VSGQRRVLGAAVRAPRRALLAVVLLASIAIWGASTLHPGSTESKTGEPIVVSLGGNLATTLDPANLNVLVALERRIASLAGVQAVLGPGRLIQENVDQIDRAIRQKVAALRTSGLSAQQAMSDVLVRYGYVGVPSIDNESFVGQLIFGSGTRPEQRFAWLFPDDNHALVLVRPRPGLSGALTQALANEVSRLCQSAPLQGVQTRLASVPVVTPGIASEFGRELGRLTPIVIAAMTLVLLIGLGRRLGSRRLHSSRSLSP
jgi:predicted RND superfamily exporter protein